MTPLIFGKLIGNNVKVNFKLSINCKISVSQQDVILYITSDVGSKMIRKCKIIHFEIRK
jgi:hypothetical protein